MVSLFTTTFNRNLAVEACPEHFCYDSGTVPPLEFLARSVLVERLSASLIGVFEVKLLLLISSPGPSLRGTLASLRGRRKAAA